MLRVMKILLVLSVAAWGLLGGVGNLADWKGTTEAVAGVTSMVTFEGGAERWQATTSPVVVISGALFITFSKIVAGLLCVVGGWRMWVARGGDAAAFAKARSIALTGCAVAVFMLFAGFIVVGDGLFEFWRNDALGEKTGSTAFRYGGMIAMIAIFVGAREDAIAPDLR